MSNLSDRAYLAARRMATEAGVATPDRGRFDDLDLDADGSPRPQQPRPPVEQAAVRNALDRMIQSAGDDVATSRQEQGW